MFSFVLDFLIRSIMYPLLKFGLLHRHNDGGKLNDYNSYVHPFKLKYSYLIITV